MACAGLVVDLLAPLGVAAGILYVALVLCGFWSSDPRRLYWLATTGSALTVVGAVASSGSLSTAAVLNRVLAVLAMWAIAIVGARYQRQAEESAYRAAIVDATDDAILSVDRNGRILSWNSAAERLYGYTADAALGQQLEMLWPTDRRDEVSGIIDGLGRGKSHDRDTSLVRRDGTLVEVWLDLAPVWRGRRWFGGALIARDITDRLRMERELRRSNADLEQFAYAASHDLVEPLRMVESFTRLLQEDYGGQLDEEANEYIEFAVDGARRMRRLIDDLLAYSRLSTRGNEPTVVAVADAIEEALANLRVAITESAAEIDVAEMPEVLADERQLAQLLQNVIGNALKFRHPDRAPRIDIRAERRGERWALAVRDNGIGMDMQYADRVFQVFQRLHSREEYAGVGMGLAMCKRIVERHQGEIWIDSTPGEGTELGFTLAAARAAH